MIISRYILKNHLAPFLFGAFTVMFLFLFQFLLKYIDKLVGKGLETIVVIQLIVLNLAWMVVLAVPMGVLFATLMAFGAMSASNEVTIIKSSGGSLLKMMRPIIIAGAILSVLLFMFNDMVLPEANHKAKIMMSDINRTKPTFSLEAGLFSTQLDGYTILARQIDSLDGTLKGVTIYDNTSHQGRNIISADTGKIKYSNDGSKFILELFDGEIHQSQTNQVNNYKIIDFAKYLIQINASGFGFERTTENLVSRGDREMRISDMDIIVKDSYDKANAAGDRIKTNLQKHIDFLFGVHSEIHNDVQLYEAEQKASISTSDDKIEILNNVQKRIAFLNATLYSDILQKNEYILQAKSYLVEIEKKYAIPFACLVFVFVGCPLGIMTKGGNFGYSAAISLGFYIIFWACLIGGEKFADRGIISPFIAMWSGNIIVAILGIILTIRVNNETISIFNFKRLINKFVSQRNSKNL